MHVQVFIFKTISLVKDVILLTGLLLMHEGSKACCGPVSQHNTLCIHALVLPAI